MIWEIEYTDEFERWWETLDEGSQEAIDSRITLLEERGPNLGFPHSSGISSSKHGHMRELRAQHKGHPLRAFYAFDPLRRAILLTGGDKAGNDRFYERTVPVADRLYDEHLKQIDHKRK